MAENWYDRKADNWYDGSSAYKIDEYYSYTEETEQKQNEKKRKKVKAVVLNHKKMFVAMGVVFAVAIAFLYANAVLIETATKVDNLNTQLEDVRVRNTQLTYDMAAEIDLAEVEDKAINEFGMQYPEAHQNVYVNVAQSDYAEVVDKSTGSTGIIDRAIQLLKSFVAYIS